jgi:type II secretory pathway pseudopilin PulG
MRTETTCRTGYTLIELLVSMTLIMVIMGILSQAFVTGLQTFGKMRSLADMAQKLRTTTNTLRRDLSADHFDSSYRPSDPGFSNYVVPREGFIRIYQAAPPVSEGTDGFNISPIANPSVCQPVGHVLHMAVKLRGNRPEDFFSASVPANDNLMNNSTFFTQPPDARCQTVNTQYLSQWAEVMYYLSPLGSSTSPQGGPSQPLYGLYRSQRLVVANSTTPNNWGLGSGAGYSSIMSVNPTNNNFNTSADLITQKNRSLNPLAPPAPTVDSLLLSNVMSFTVRPIFNPTAGTSGFVPTDTSYDSNAQITGYLMAVAISIRVWDLKAQQTRQITIIQDL